MPVSEKVYSDRLMELLLKARFPTEFIERRAIEHRQAPTGWQITSADIDALTVEETRQLQHLMAKIMEFRGEITVDEALEMAEHDAKLIDVTPVEVVEDEDDELAQRLEIE